MVLNQLFVSKPPFELVNNIIKKFGLKHINDTKQFSYIDMNKNNTLSIFNSLENELNKYYLPCKKKKYLNNVNTLTNKQAITILRQLLKVYNYDLFSKEKFIKGTKYSVYKIISKNDKIFNLNKKNKEIIILFD
jgi:hypothetical protein